MRKMYSNIERLLRTNTALAALCIISIGVLFILIRGSDSVPSSSTKPETMVIGGQHSFTSPTPEQALSASPLRHMPSPSKFTSFVYKGEKQFEINVVCKDAYYVILMFSNEVDYRTDTLSALYNTAERCTMKKSYRIAIPLTQHLTIGASYYIIRADEGAYGTWYDPY